jgi:hypothetical protein
MPSADRLPELGPRGEGWVVLQLLLDGDEARPGDRGAKSKPRMPRKESAVIAVAGALLVLLGRARARPLVHAAATTPRPHASAAGRDLPARASSGVRGRALDRAWLVACRCAAGTRPDCPARAAPRPQSTPRGGLAERALRHIRGLPSANAAPVCALALLSLAARRRRQPGSRDMHGAASVHQGSALSP